MRLALLKGNRFNPWHLAAFAQLPDTEVTAFRAESEIQRYFAERGGDTLPFAVERVAFDTQVGPMRFLNTLAERYAGRAPKVLPFQERLRGFDVIQSWELFTEWTAQALDAKREYDIPVSLMIWDNIVFNNERTPEQRAIKMRALDEADRFLVHTERSRRMLQLEGAPEEKIVTIQPGVDLQTFSPAPADRASLGIGEDETVLLFVGWLLPRKGIDYLLCALRGLLDDPALSDHNFRLLIVGSGPGRDRVDALVTRLRVGPHCTFLGSLPYEEMPAIYRAADCFVLPSIATETWQEQFGMALMEAMATGVACVGSQSGAIPEILDETGLLCQPNDVVDLQDAITAIVTSPGLRADCGARARARAEDLYGLDDYTAALAQVYQGMTS